MFQNTTFTVDPTLCFVIMPFSNEFDELYQDHIKSCVSKSGFNAIRADEIFGTNIIMDDVWSSINTARFIIAEVTGRNPNVFYELGLAHAIGKIVIILTQDISDVPFDTRHIRHITYEFTPRGVKKLMDILSKTIAGI